MDTFPQPQPISFVAAQPIYRDDSRLERHPSTTRGAMSRFPAEGALGLRSNAIEERWWAFQSGFLSVGPDRVQTILTEQADQLQNSTHWMTDRPGTMSSQSDIESPDPSDPPTEVL